MNKLEKSVYNVLKHHPKLKTFIRNIYQNLFDILPEKGNYFINNPIIYEGYFFGFHDLCPFSSNDNLLLANKLEISLKMPKRDDPLTVGYWDLEKNRYFEIGQSFAWNYHKGCRLQWLGKDNNHIVYNSSIDNKLCSFIYDVKTKQTKKIDFAIDTVSPDGSFATSFSYERLNVLMPGYGYDCTDTGYINDRCPDKTGLYIVNLISNTASLILSIEEIVNIKQNETMKNARHFITHTEFSHDGTRISFLHRWVKNDVNKRFTRLITCNLDGTDIQISRTTGMFSHYVWDNRNRILAYCQVDGVDGHYLFLDHKLQQTVRVAKQLNSDGHQSFINETNYFVTDTYPNRRRYASIYVCDINNDKVNKIVEVKSYKKFQSKDIYHHWACDLHPRISPSGKYVCFDSVHTGNRAICYMDISNCFKNNEF